MRTRLGAVSLVLLAATGCGSEATTSADSASQSESASPSTSAPTTSEAAVVQNLRDICPQVESALPNDSIPDYTGISDFYDTLGSLKEAGDLESQNALDLLIDPTGTLQIEIQYASKGQPLTTALSDWIDGISAFADRCQSAGSSALQ